MNPTVNHDATRNPNVRHRLRAGAMVVCSLALWAGLAFADPSVRVSYVHGVARIELEGDWANSRYTVLRATSATASGIEITDTDILCLGSCFVDDVTAEPGATYWYRFHLVLADGGIARFGPFPVRISEAARPVRAALSPNPFRGGASVELFFAGGSGDAPVDATVDLLDLQGRRVATLVRGTFRRGISRLVWNGRGDGGRELAAGAYFLRISSPLGSQVARVQRVR